MHAKRLAIDEQTLKAENSVCACVSVSVALKCTPSGYSRLACVPLRQVLSGGIVELCETSCGLRNTEPKRAHKT